ncbi:hypothetical protein ACRARG_06280 [Pseudooceanicola sp. C21-150M6]|uniref:hypothetical protein n=1 Tax=Pseudooceanicola sp. C21-150M6 TaxID=3434355 RepID=UPI003D7F8BCF
MAQATTQITTSGFRDRIDAFFTAVSVGMGAYMHRRSRADQIAALNAKSDEELAKLGITRDGIPAYVFRDLFYV